MTAQENRPSFASGEPQELVISGPLTIGSLARLTGISAKAIRYYEEMGLLPPAERAGNRYRHYGQADINRLMLLRRIRLLGVPLSAARSLLAITDEARCAEVQHELLHLVDERLTVLDREIAELRVLRSEVQRYQRALVACHPDKEESFRECQDMRCAGLAGGAETLASLVFVADKDLLACSEEHEEYEDHHEAVCCC